MSTTPNTGLQLLAANSLQLSPAYNESMQKLDALVQLIPMSKEVTAPPATVDTDMGKSWIIPAGATGEWAGKTNQIALCTSPGLWVYFVPRQGWYAHVTDENKPYRYTGTVWQVASDIVGDGIPDAPSDGKIYGRKNNTWAEATGGSGGGVPEAPVDGTPYLREDGSWVPLPAYPTPGIGDAPNDGKRYVRQSGAWTEANAKFASVVNNSDAALLAVPEASGNYTRFTNAATKTYTFNSSQSYVVGSEYHGRNVGDGNLTLTVAGTFVLNAPYQGTLVVPKGGTFTIKIVGAAEADVIGVTVAP